MDILLKCTAIHMTVITVTVTAIINRSTLRTGPTITPGPGSRERERRERKEIWLMYIAR